MSMIGTRLDDTSFRIAVAIRLGAPVCTPHQCICGAPVEGAGLHGLSCRKSSGRIARHSAINGLIKTALSAAEVPSRLEPQGLVHGDNKRPDGVSTMPWSEGRCLAWDFTCPDTLAPSHINRAILGPGVVASDAETLKTTKYAQLPTSMLFVPIAIETFGAFGEEAAKFMSELGRRLTRTTQDSRSASFLFQRLSVTMQRGNAACVLGTIPVGCSFDSFSLL